MDPELTPVIFTPDNEPYLGRELLFHFDQLISSAMEQNSITAPTSHGRILTDHQSMACQIIAQALSITLSIGNSFDRVIYLARMFYSALW
jgi:hypothetical protein